ncbi:hypothetical protein [Flavobacterium sp. N502540]|uniref:hypothetical protein n=1 Tax=Flavobacterium sp. N502540 TaxID=2986838 RepID=UPI002223F819|nr:hypothetical protein [Flavobacterium sp. N502540]
MKFKFIFLILLFSNISRSQISTTSALAPTITNAGLGNLYKTSDTNQLYIGLSNGTLSLIGGGANSWSLNGNSNATATSVLGTTTDTKVALTSNTTSILEVGKRSTLGLVTTAADFSDPNQYMAYLRGNGVSALQFEVPAASSFKSMFFSNSDGNFRWKGSSAGNDFFEIGSAGTNDSGSLEIITGDNGDEPIIFKKYHFIDGTFEMMRIQGQGTGTAGTVRVGIFTNGAVANSVLQVGGSVSLPIRAVTGSTTLTDTDYTLILKPGVYSSAGAVTFPAASTCKGRIYIIKNTTGGNKNTTTFYLDRGGSSTAVMGSNRIYSFQSDGTDWQLISDDY